MANHELLTTTEQLSKSELGKIAHETAAEIATNLLGIPEFNAALIRTFFGRSFAYGGRSSIDDGVFFELDGFGYNLSYRGVPLRLSPSCRGIYDAKLDMVVTKYGAEPEEGADRPVVASFHLYSNFNEDQDGKVIEHKHGGVNLSDESGEYSGSEAFEKIKENFGALYPAPISL